MKPRSRKSRRPAVLASGDPRSYVSTAVHGSCYGLIDMEDVLMRDSSVASDTSSDALRGASAANSSLHDHSDGGSSFNLSRINQALRSCEKTMKISKQADRSNKKLQLTQLEPSLQQMIFLERAFISPILESSSPLTPDQIRILTSILN